MPQHHRPAPSDGPSEGPTVADVGEDALVAQVVARLARASGAAPRVLVGPGDDAAVLTVDGPVVTSTDTLVQDVDFRLDWSTGAQVGRKTAVQVLADVEAMGAVPVGLLVALVVPGATPLSWCLDLADGLAEEAALAGVAVLGGDVADGSALVVTGTSVGHLLGPAPAVRRGGAGPGDVVALGGPVGASQAGLELLLAGHLDAGAGDAGAGVDGHIRHALAVHRSPAVDHTAGARARDAGATAMVDVSDGLVRDAVRLARASGVVLDLDPAALRPDEGLLAVASRLGRTAEDAGGWVLTSGEEHAMLVCLPEGARLPDGFRPVGRVLASSADQPPGVLVGGRPHAGTGGWTHYA